MTHTDRHARTHACICARTHTHTRTYACTSCLYSLASQGSDTFETYKNLCCRAFLTLRRHADLIINLFSMVTLQLSLVPSILHHRTCLQISLSPFPPSFLPLSFPSICTNLPFSSSLLSLSPLFPFVPSLPLSPPSRCAPQESLSSHVWRIQTTSGMPC